MTLIPLSRGLFAQVDDDKAVWASQWKWHVQKRVREGRAYCYAARNEPTGLRKPKQRGVLMHRALMGTPRGRDVDHCDFDTLNNQVLNLREATKAENSRHKRKQVGKHSSQFKGVSWFSQMGLWKAEITKDGVREYLGLFKDETAAARSYNKAATRLFGEFALLNSL